MSIFFRNTIALVAGLICGALVNILLVMLGSAVIPAPEGLDTSSTESLKKGAHLLEPKHYLFPFLAHALGTFAGALEVASIAKSRQRLLAMMVGVFFLLGGLIMASSVPAPSWFLILDLGLAYLPMAWLGGKLGDSLHRKRANR